jgi:hypothetical protein
VNLSLPISLLVRVFFLAVHAGILCDQTLAYGRISKSRSFGAVFHGVIVGWKKVLCLRLFGLFCAPFLEILSIN